VLKNGKQRLEQTVMRSTTFPEGLENIYDITLQIIFDKSNYCCWLANVFNWQVINIPESGNYHTGFTINDMSSIISTKPVLQLVFRS